MGEMSVHVEKSMWVFFTVKKEVEPSKVLLRMSWRVGWFLMMFVEMFP